MLTELSIKNFAIIEQLAISFDEGLTVLTGETGAGKSIIIDAVQLLAGSRGSIDFVRHGAKKAELEGLFTIDEAHVVHDLGATYGIDTTDGMVVLNRDITAAGKSICRINGKLVTLATLKEFGHTLIDIHSQHETQSLLNQDQHLRLLDLYNEKQIAPIKSAYQELYFDLSQMKIQYRQLNHKEQDLAQKLDLLQFQSNEIANANLNENEDDALLEERKKLANFEKIHQALEEAYEALYGDQKGMDWLAQAMQALQNGQDYDEYIQAKADELANYYYAAEELTYDLRSHLDTLQFDSSRLNVIEARLDEISRLKHKYGPSVNEIIAYEQEVNEEIQQIQNKDSFLSELAIKIEQVEKEAYQKAVQLHDVREKAAHALTRDIKKELKGLYMDKSVFKIVFETTPSEEKTSNYVKLNQNGYDHVHFELSTNPGEPLKPLHKIASGGEMSRIMLALKTIFAKHEGVTSVIFDEVDTGVSGRVAQAMAEKIQHISEGSQVLCITHLPQVAAMADHHKYIGKDVSRKRTATYIIDLNIEDKIEELGRMITGAEMTETAKDHAKELLELAFTYKETQK
ncbi:DNA repair protein RecN [Lentibacillus sp. JNUCC-1]|uniref:DNA repair protein RecN n=1 Tax=Lentibacillus sp. JNUCC-1 TaxID=2654513 RepID=UPI0012E97725|nr:DNA repair protein RecN [Lentibacillus sp. JNUCC-1]MUV39687.1 DNA repair protein RecN [Lentibacillus sp. JNUCC-1]